MSSQNQKSSIGSTLGGFAGGLAGSPQVQAVAAGFLANLLQSLLDRIFHPHVSQPASERPPVDDVPDDKIIPAPKPVPRPVTPPPTGYTGLKLAIFKAQYNHELFPEQYTPDNTMGLYRPAKQDVYNRRSKVWYDATPFKGDHAVQQDEGAADGILWKPVFHLSYGGSETIVKAGNVKGPDGEPIQVVDGESVGAGVSAWKFAKGYLCQINVGDNEGVYEAYVEIPEMGLRSDVVTFTVS